MTNDERHGLRARRTCGTGAPACAGEHALPSTSTSMSTRGAHLSVRAARATRNLPPQPGPRVPPPVIPRSASDEESTPFPVRNGPSRPRWPLVAQLAASGLCLVRTYDYNRRYDAFRSFRRTPPLAERPHIHHRERQRAAWLKAKAVRQALRSLHKYSIVGFPCPVKRRPLCLSGESPFRSPYLLRFHGIGIDEPGCGGYHDPYGGSYCTDGRQEAAPLGSCQPGTWD